MTSEDEPSLDPREAKRTEPTESNPAELEKATELPEAAIAPVSPWTAAGQTPAVDHREDPVASPEPRPEPAWESSESERESAVSSLAAPSASEQTLPVPAASPVSREAAPRDTAQSSAHRPGLRKTAPFTRAGRTKTTTPPKSGPTPSKQSRTPTSMTKTATNKTASKKTAGATVPAKKQATTFAGAKKGTAKAVTAKKAGTKGAVSLAPKAAGKKAAPAKAARPAAKKAPSKKAPVVKKAASVATKQSAAKRR
jgi:hypothetical protein